MLFQLNIKPISKFLVRWGKAGNVLLKCYVSIRKTERERKKEEKKKKRTILGETTVSLISKMQRTFSCGQCSKPSSDWLWSFPPSPPNNGACDCAGPQAGCSVCSCSVTGQVWCLEAPHFLWSKKQGNWKQSWKPYLISTSLIQVMWLAKGWSSGWLGWK